MTSKGNYIGEKKGTHRKPKKGKKEQGAHIDDRK
jgi:hypothetical protein